MKERIKKFYGDHKEAVVVGTTVMIGAMIGGFYGGMKIHKAHEITGVDLFEAPGESRKILVFKQNGMIYGFQEKP